MSGAFEGAWLLLKSILNRPDIDSLVAVIEPQGGRFKHNWDDGAHIQLFATDHDEAHDLMEGSHFRTDGMFNIDAEDRRLHDIIREITSNTGILNTPQSIFDRQVGQGTTRYTDPRVFSALLTDPESYEMLGIPNTTETGSLMGDYIEQQRKKQAAVSLGGINFDAASGDVGMVSLSPGMGGLGLGGHLMGLALQTTEPKRIADSFFTGSGARSFDRLAMQAIGNDVTSTFVHPESEYHEPRLSLAGNDFTYERPLLQPGAEDIPDRFAIRKPMSLSYAGDDATPVSDVHAYDWR